MNPRRGGSCLGRNEFGPVRAVGTGGRDRVVGTGAPTRPPASGGCSVLPCCAVVVQSKTISGENTVGTEAIARAIDLQKIYGTGEAQVKALRGVSVDFGRGEMTAIMGPSGSGKSTLMHCMAALDRPTAGEIEIDGVQVRGLKDKALTQLRRDRLGFIFQSFNLVPTLTARENITLPLDIAGRKVDQEWFDRVVDTVGLRDRLKHRPTELSGGQQQRVACARALVSRPAIVFADEPTGNLDSRASAEILSFLQNSVREFGQSIVIVTHDPVAAGYADRVLFLADGEIVDEMAAPTADKVLERMRGFDAAGRRS
ncbi:ABC transporter ATP-binding protein [Kineosporia sp. J2-2]|uniref:ABC transporter ATP-binding protein n=1 Tax=Kineosporia corallincola TaxID=2835133 RepID=A0ABS5TPF5_9ACTN|nr:ABC transporter ATP-binding protein [Kineosporia corallincola]